MSVQFSKSAAKRVISGIRMVEGMSAQTTAPPKRLRHPRRKPPSGGLIIWQADETYAENSSSLCADKVDAELTELRVKVTRRPCGMTKVFGEDEDGYIDVFDEGAGGFLAGRTAGDVNGVSGFATLMSGPTPEDDCQWIITWINWFEERQFVQDWYVSGLDIVEEKVNAKVWDWCQLPDEVTEGVDCVDDY